MAKTSKIRYQDDELNVRIEIREARVIDGYKRQVMLSNLVGSSPPISSDTPVTDVATYILKAFTYPNVISATTRIVNLKGAKKRLPESPEKLTFEALLELPEKLVRIWEDAVIELNPHWMPNVGLASTTENLDDEEEESEVVREEKKEEEPGKNT